MSIPDTDKFLPYGVVFTQIGLPGVLGTLDRTSKTTITYAPPYASSGSTYRFPIRSTENPKLLIRSINVIGSLGKVVIK